MNAKHKKFIREKLIPYVLRDQGRGFAMSEWLNTELIPFEPIDDFCYDDVKNRVAPACGTVACIGGSIEALTRKIEDKARNYDFEEGELAEHIGLTVVQGHTLFYGWAGSEDMDPLYDYTLSEDGETICPPWPPKYVAAYARAKTPLAKAKVAVRLLEEVAKTGGKILNGN